MHHFALMDQSGACSHVILCTFCFVHALIILTLKAPRKTASENVVCLCCLLNSLTNFSNLFFAYQCNSLSCPPGQLAPRGARYPRVSCPPPWAACPRPQKTWQTQFKMIFIFFITNLYHTIIRTVVMYVFHYFTFYGRRLGLRYCSLSIFLPNSEVLVDTIQKDILSLLIEFPIEQVIREFPVSDITYLSSNRKGQGLR